jgi:hypothetical protein
VAAAVHYTYAQPIPSNGGTDAISIYRGSVLISGSAPGTTGASAPSVDDTAWPSGPSGALYATDNGADTIYRITGAFARGSELIAVTPCDQNNAPSTCPGPGFPANYLGELSPRTGRIAPVRLSGPAVEPQGLLFLP